MSDLKEEFNKVGIPVNQGVVMKPINDASSSAYHNW